MLKCTLIISQNGAETDQRIIVVEEVWGNSSRRGLGGQILFGISSHGWGPMGEGVNKSRRVERKQAVLIEMKEDKTFRMIFFFHISTVSLLHWQVSLRVPSTTHSS